MAKKPVRSPNASRDAGAFPDFGAKPSMGHVGGAVLNLGLVNGQKQRRLEFDDAIQDGVTTQTANGTSHDTGTGWNKTFNWPTPQLPVMPLYPGGKSNRTGE